MEIDTDKLQQACTRAIQYLDCARSPVGWTDFQTRTSGASEDWITAFVLSHTNCQFASVHQSFADYLEERNAVIGYNANVPPDADSSAWAMYTLTLGNQLVGEKTLGAWLPFILGHWTEDQRVGFSTYASCSPITDYKYRHGGWSNFRGWTQTPCDEITALVFITLCRMKQIKLAEAHVEKWLDCFVDQRAVYSYWWTSPWYTVRLIVAALNLVRGEFPRLHSTVENALTAVAGFAERELMAERALTPFDLSAQLVACSALTQVHDSTRVRQSIGKCAFKLSAYQGSDGSWSSRGVMRIPEPDDVAPWASSYFRTDVSGTGGILSDSGVLTTASAYFALSTAKNIISASK